MSDVVALTKFLGATYNIPSYQRGYRWEEQEVTELLDDLWRFCNDSSAGEFYCLQPIVLQKRGENEYDVLDGQQRLTTLFLLLTYLESFRFELNYRENLFFLKYQTRTRSETFLANKEFVGSVDSNIDFDHMCRAYVTINKWFDDERHRGAKSRLVPILMDETAVGHRNVRFIKYLVADDIQSPVDIFIRLNVGKISLTDAELTKALLLQKDKYSDKELDYVKMRLFAIASEWDRIEYSLQEEELWFFLTNEVNNKFAHIEFIFDLIADNLLQERKYFEKKPLKYSTFLILSAYLEEQIIKSGKKRIDAVEHIWKLVTEYFEFFLDWFHNRKLFHYIGFIISNQGHKSIDVLIAKAKKETKADFESYLEEEIANMIRIKKTRLKENGNHVIQLKELTYYSEDGSDRPEIHQILFLHNVYTTLKQDKERARFPFNLYKQTKQKKKWSLEHIHAQNSHTIKNKDSQILWLQDHIHSLSTIKNNETETMMEQMQGLIDRNEIDQSEFDSIVTKVHDFFNKKSGITDGNLHSISNLCLVDADTNSQLNNSVFDVKREKIKKRELQGHYIPICTRNVFLKAYSQFPKSNAYWSENDRQSYLQSILETYEHFVHHQ